MTTETSKIDRAIVLSSNNVEVQNGVIYLPLYMAPLIFSGKNS